MDESPSGEPNSSSASQEILRFSWGIYQSYRWNLATYPFAGPRSVESTLYHSYFLKILLRLSSRLLQGLPSSFFSSGFPNETQYSFHLSPILLHFKEYFTTNIHSSPLVLYTSLFCGTFVAPGRCVQGFGEET